MNQRREARDAKRDDWLKHFEVVTEEIETGMPRSRLPVSPVPAEWSLGAASEHAAA